MALTSATTIVATTSQGCKLNDKFKANIYIALPAAIICCVLYFVVGLQYKSADNIPEISLLTVIPYLLVIAAAICGLNVMLVLTLGILSSIFINLFASPITMLEWCKAAGEGILGMGELIIVVLLASGIMGVIKYLGGIEYIVDTLLKRLSTKRSAEYATMLFIWIVNICTANNTIALITTADIIRKISESLKIDPRRAASVMDTSSCIIQGVLPYGAQMLMAATLVKLSPLEILPHLYYIYTLALMLILSIAFQYPRKFTHRTGPWLADSMRLRDRD